MTTQAALRNRVAPRKASKYKNRKSGGYDSKRESKRARELKFLQMDGQITELREQVRFVLIPDQRGTDGKLIERQCAYVADFVYRDSTGCLVVEDTKGFRTSDYVLKRKMMLHFHGIRIVEI